VPGVPRADLLELQLAVSTPLATLESHFLRSGWYVARLRHRKARRAFLVEELSPVMPHPSFESHDGLYRGLVNMTVSADDGDILGLVIP